jgi:hypothetical protein
MDAGERGSEQGCAKQRETVRTSKHDSQANRNR